MKKEFYGKMYLGNMGLDKFNGFLTVELHESFCVLLSIANLQERNRICKVFQTYLATEALCYRNCLSGSLFQGIPFGKQSIDDPQR